MGSILLDEHCNRTVDKHRTYGRDFQFPIISEIFRLFEGKLMTTLQNLKLIAFTVSVFSVIYMAQDSDGDIDVFGPFTLALRIVRID